jgi:sensor c-di-GMP phosphodiesterase-like protein
LKRDDWMMMPPKQDDLAARLDPTKQRPRGFNTGKGARGPSATGEDNSIWNETPQEKQKRLADEMMGVSKPSSLGPQRPPKASDSMRGENAAKKIKEHTVCLMPTAALVGAMLYLLMLCYRRRREDHR